MTDALVIGGGIAGPVAAMALQQVGVRARILDARPGPEHALGNFINLGPNGLAALDCLGVSHLATDLGFATHAMSFRSHRDRPITGRIPISSPTGHVIRTLRRPAFYRALVSEARRRGVQIEHDTRLVDAEVTADGSVLAETADGRRHGADLLIGADGVWSRTRTVIDPGAPAPRPLGVYNVFGSSPAADVPGEPGDLTMCLHRRMFFMYLNTPDDGIWWFANPTSVPGSRPSPERLRDHLVHELRGDRGPVADIVRTATEVSTPRPAFDLPSAPVWSRGPMVLIGDAAHAVSQTAGQGGAQALEDAVVLGQCIRDNSTAEAAFQAFETVRRPRTEAVVALGKHNKDGNVAGPLERIVRNFAIGRVFRARSTTNANWPHHHVVDYSDDLSLARLHGGRDATGRNTDDGKGIAA